MRDTDALELTFAPLDAETWPALEELFGRRGASGGCWCMWWRRQKKEFEAGKGEGNRRALEELAGEGRPLGVLAFEDDVPVAWCAVAPREDYPRMERSRILARVDDRPVWSVSCFFVRRSHRDRGVSLPLLRAAVDWAALQGADVVEGYPHEPGDERMPGVFAWTGFASTFRAAGFEEVARRSGKRPIMRLEL